MMGSCHAGALMHFWTGLYAEVDRKLLINGVNTMLKVASDLLLSQRQHKEQCKRLKQDGGQDEEDQHQ